MSSGEQGPQEYGDTDGTGRLLAGRYRVTARLGRGGMGVVWRAVDEVLGREVAVKELRTYTDAAGPELSGLRLRMQREARAAARVRHPGVVAVHDVTEVDGRPLIVMELIDGPSLDGILRERGTLDPYEAARIGLAVTDALAAAHRSGVLHRDVKPGNILLDRSGRVVLTDFGIATMDDPADGSATRLTRSGELVGSLDYLAPERAQGGEPGAPADVGALGATLYAAVEGTSPFRRTSTYSTLTAIVSEPLPEPRRAGPLAPVLRRLMDKRPDSRPDAEEAREALREVERARPSDTPTTTLRPTTPATPAPPHHDTPSAPPDHDAPSAPPGFGPAQPATANPADPLGPTASGSVDPHGSADLHDAVGSHGSDRLYGSAGPQGPVDSHGSVGAHGSAGAHGPVGPQGPVDSHGSASAYGPAGPHGPASPYGSAGAQGPVGSHGSASPQGPVDSHGPAGPRGSEGPYGPVASQAGVPMGSVSAHREGAAPHTGAPAGATPAGASGAPTRPMSTTSGAPRRKGRVLLAAAAVAVVLAGAGVTVALLRDQGAPTAGPGATASHTPAAGTRRAGTERSAQPGHPRREGGRSTGPTGQPSGAGTAEPSSSASASVSASAPAEPSPSPTPTSGTSHTSSPAASCLSIGGGKYNCEVWRTATSYTASGAAAGTVNAGTNYFYCQANLGRRETYGRWTNVWWAKTDDDSGNTGVYVSDVYLKGGTNDAPVPGLPVC
ncbi:serine/threonine-protein kinase [Streptomyces alanosinicus]|uniref:non-specific serine/threonine protein kinase n=1 Tax=Streptomyces alanosinicus TaxID=68171 RepID=A0A918YH61_9ACTN|nr:serine/threonine-protein kinase [Streptomyces alanosinicus]GHE03053.1 hypothetical protein GCM10010339_28810 [Streptomyces alanosinicus]